MVHRFMLLFVIYLHFEHSECHDLTEVQLSQRVISKELLYPEELPKHASFSYLAKNN